MKNEGPESEDRRKFLLGGAAGFVALSVSSLTVFELTEPESPSEAEDMVQNTMHLIRKVRTQSQNLLTSRGQTTQEQEMSLGDAIEKLEKLGIEMESLLSVYNSTPRNEKDRVQQQIIELRTEVKAHINNVVTPAYQEFDRLTKDFREESV